MRRVSSCLALCVAALSWVTFAAASYQVQLPRPTRALTYLKKAHALKRHHKLSLREAILLALRFNTDVQNAELQRVIDKFDLDLKYWAFHPHYSLNGSAVYSEGVPPEYQLTPSVSIQTPIGTKLSADFNNQLVGSESPSIDVKLTQPLLRGFGADVNSDSVALQNQIDQEVINKLTLKNTIMQTIVSVIQQYLQLAEDYNTLHIARLQLQQSEATYREYKIRIKAGKMPPREIIQQESNIAQQKYSIQNEEDSLQQDYHRLLNLLGLKSTAKIDIDRNIQAKTVSLPNEDLSKRLALANNVSYRSAQIQLKQANQNLLQAEDQQKWQLDMEADATITNRRLIKGIGPDITSPAQSSRSVSLNLSVPIDDMQNKEALVNARIALERQQVNLAQAKRQTEINVASQLRTIRSQQRQIRLAYMSAKLAQQSYEIENIKWKHNRSSNIDLNSALESLREAQNSVIAAKIGYINALASYQENIGSLLNVWHVHIRY